MRFENWNSNAGTKQRLSDSYGSPPSLKQQEADLVAAIEQTDRLNRFNAALIGQSLEFLQGTLRLWQRSPQSAALYSSSGAAVAGSGGRVTSQRITGGRMSGLNGLFGIGSNALATFQRALSVTGQNIANVSTPGYSRQEITLSESLPENGQPGQIGTGVTATEIRRSVDSFVEQQLLSSNERVGQFGASHKALSQIQLVFNDANDQGIAAGLNEFFKAWQDVATNPADLTARTVLLTKADGLTKLLNQADAQLSAQRTSLDGQVQSGINDVNALASKIADLNSQIKLTEISGQQANDLRDQRGRFLNDLAGLVDISSIEDATGQVTVFVGIGQVLVAEKTAYRLTGVANIANNGLLDVRYDGGNRTQYGHHVGDQRRSPQGFDRRA
jgi:flagellar basal body rod protein FlgB